MSQHTLDAFERIFGKLKSIIDWQGNLLGEVCIVGVLVKEVANFFFYFIF